MTEWHTSPQADLTQAIVQFKLALPGWWYSVCECQVSCDASCAPTTESPDVALIDQDGSFDSGFHADLRQPSTLAEALQDVMAQALAAKAALPQLRGRNGKSPVLCSKHTYAITGIAGCECLCHRKR